MEVDAKELQEILNHALKKGKFTLEFNLIIYSTNKMIYLTGISLYS